MNCHEAREQFSALIDEALDADERAALEAHLATCADCRRELQRFRDTVSLMRAAAPARAPAGFVDRVLEAASPRPWPQRLLHGLFLPWPVKLPMEAAALVLVAVGVALVYRGSPELQQSARQEPAAPTTTQAPRDTASEVKAPEAKAPVSEAPAASPERVLPRVLYGAKEDKAREQDTSREVEKPKEAARAQEMFREQPGSLTDQKRVETPAPAPSAAQPAVPSAPQPAAPAPQAAAPARDADLQKAPEKKWAQESQDRQAPVAGKLEAPATGAERQRSMAKDVRPGVTQQTESRADALKAQRPASPPPAVASSAFVPADVSGQLAVSDREPALRGLKELVAQIGAVETSRFDTSDGPIIEIAVRREKYAELKSGLARLGRWQPTSEPSALPATVRVVVRIIG
jgi:hypothetical protein